MRTSFVRFLSTTALLALPAMLWAEEPAKQADKGSSYNMVLISLVTLMVILLFVIGGLSYVLRQLVFTYRDKERAKRSNNIAAKAILFLLALSIPSYVMAQAAADTTVAVKHVSPYINGIARADFYALMSFIGFELFIIFSLLLIIRTIIRLLRDRPELHAEAKAIRRRSFFERFNKSVAVENEAAILTDHDYDGIRELDNDLPPWWKYGFYVTIVVAIIYVWYFNFGGGPSQTEEYIAEVHKADEEKAEYLAKTANNVDENTVKPVTDPAALGTAQNTFQTICSACHAKDGGGGVGPNLTDDYWIHGGNIKDVFKSIKYGWPDKGMKSWKDDFSPTQIAALATYVKSLHGTKPAAPKDKQGELYVESGAKPTDSTANLKTDDKKAALTIKDKEGNASKS
ncbi:MAG: cbb3-type cytochrome c oxidase N-terminal domain-containing protein [Flavipsychrobacter sp.]